MLKNLVTKEACLKYLADFDFEIDADSLEKAIKKMRANYMKGIEPMLTALLRWTIRKGRHLIFTEYYR